MTAQVDSRRIREIRSGTSGNGPVVYWISRDQRAHDNWALLYAQACALKLNRPLAVVFNLVPEFLDATIRQYGFMLDGLKEVGAELDKLNIPLIVLAGDPTETIPEFVADNDVSLLVCDMSPLRIHRSWVHGVAEKIAIPFSRVDAHNIVPIWETSDKQEFAAHTIRPKINKRLEEFLTDFPKLKKHPVNWPRAVPTADWNKLRKSLKVDTSVPQVTWLTPGAKAADRVFDVFLNTRLADYGEKRNDPNSNLQSELSPYLHFGQISAQRVALTMKQHDEHIASQEGFLEQLVIRRELSDNFCWYNQNYDSWDGLPDWGRETLNEHRSDPRQYICNRDDFEHARTHDELWNAAQQEMVTLGKMHGYMRMYWAKKILEWSANPEDALQTAIRLNDKYELDGRDPNGYAGVAWSIGGLHDRPFAPRDIFGKIRFMSYNGCKRKFDVAAYINRVNQLKREPTP